MIRPQPTRTYISLWFMPLFHCMEYSNCCVMFSFPRAALDAQLEQKVDFMNTFGGVSTGYSTWYFFSTTSAGVPCDPHRYQNVTCKLYWSLIGRRNRHYASLYLWHETQQRPARFKSAQPAKDRTQLLFEQMHLFVSTKKIEKSPKAFTTRWSPLEYS